MFFCFREERIFRGKSANYLEIVALAASLSAPIHFSPVENLTVAEIDECLAACNLRLHSDNSCDGFYIGTEGTICHLGHFVTMDSGLGTIVTEAVQMYSIHAESVGKQYF